MKKHEKWFDEETHKQFKVDLLIASWAIWLTRNASIFKGKVSLEFQVEQQIISL